MNLKLVFLIIFAAVSVVHLVSLFFKQRLFQAVTKGFLMPVLLAMYVFGAEKVFWPVVLALVLGCAGDIFLVRINVLLFFRLGLASFLLGHIFYIIALFEFARPFNITALLVSIAAAVVFEIVIFKVVHPNKEMKIPVIFYETVIVAMAIFALQVFLAQGGLSGISGTLVFAGSLCFLASDSILARFTFGSKPKYGDFLVMLTYLAAQFLITLGFCALV